jgi:hypothetical protein
MKSRAADVGTVPKRPYPYELAHDGCSRALDAMQIGQAQVEWSGDGVASGTVGVGPAAGAG